MRDPAHRPVRTRPALKAGIAVSMAAVLFVAPALPAWAADSMTLTFVRHAESAGNASGDNSDPDPHITDPVGVNEALAVAQVLAAKNAVKPYDGIYASTYVRTQETARPIAAAILGKPAADVTIGTGNSDVVVVPGIREIYSADLASQSEGLTALVYLAVGLQWIVGYRYARIPGAEDGNEFDARMDAGVQAIYDSGDRNALAVSHGAAMMFWIMMNVDNPDPLLIVTAPLDNTSIVVLTGNPEDGWHMQNWNGIEQSAEPSLPSKLLVDTRNLVIDTSDSGYAVSTALTTGDPQAVADALAAGVLKVGNATVRFASDVSRDLIDAVGDVFPTAALTAAPESARLAIAGNLSPKIPDFVSGAKAAVDDVRAAATDAVATSQKDLEKLVKGGLKPSATTALGVGKKAGPSQGTVDASKRLRSAVRDAGDQAKAQLKASVKKVQKAAKKLADRADKARAKAAVG